MGARRNSAAEADASITPAPWPEPREPGSAPRGADPTLLSRLAGWVALSGPDRERIEVRAPFTGEVLGSIPRGEPTDIVAAVARARRAQGAWARTPFAERRRIFLRFHDLLLERRDQVLDLVQLESGKARRHAFEELADTAMVARYYARNAERMLRPRRRRGALPGLTVTRQYRQPVGVVGFIVPWNYPLNLAITDAIPALMAGNAGILKPDVQTSFTALAAAELLYEAGLPPALFPVVTGGGPELGPALVEQVDYLMFTGSTATGKTVARRAAARLIGYSLELGGKNPMLVLADADVDAAVEGALRGCFVGAGQVCVSIERLLVHRSLLDAFRGRLLARIASMRLGPALDYTVDMGSLTSRRQLDTVTEHVRDALAGGATLLCGGRHRPDLGPYFYEPTVLAGVEPGMKAYAEETFGPVAALYAFDSVAEAIERANDTRYGLSASVWTRSPGRAAGVARRLRFGSVNVNEAYAAAWASVDSPIGGMKESGQSRRHGAEGILKYTESQTVAMQRLLPIAPPPALPERAYTRALSGLLRAMRHVPGL
jgi:succinate-semialdehyde dehydrogenase / glutarate-semialdehyde dehydrogenase